MWKSVLLFSFFVLKYVHYEMILRYIWAPLHYCIFFIFQCSYLLGKSLQISEILSKIAFYQKSKSDFFDILYRNFCRAVVTKHFLGRYIYLLCFHKKFDGKQTNYPTPPVEIGIMFWDSQKNTLIYNTSRAFRGQKSKIGFRESLKKK